LNESSNVSSQGPAPEPGGMIASRSHSDRLALTGRAGQGVVGYRSEFLHLWVVAASAGDEVDPQPIIEALLDLEIEVSSDVK